MSNNEAFYYALKNKSKYHPAPQIGIRQPTYMEPLVVALCPDSDFEAIINTLNSHQHIKL